jgi:pyruvate dehydrogenase E1 component alpha subunit
MNVAVLWELPIIFMCENNTFSEFTPGIEVTAGRISDRARAFGMAVHDVDGNDAVAVWRAAGEAVERARAGQGPSFIEAATYRIQGHLEAEALFLQGGRYREEAEIEAWRAKDPIDRLKGRLVSSGVAGEGDLESVNARILDVVGAAADYAEAGQPADPELASTLMFVGQEA